MQPKNPYTMNKNIYTIKKVFLKKIRKFYLKKKCVYFMEGKKIY